MPVLDESPRMKQETDAVRDRYARRTSQVDPLRYSMLDAANWQTVQERQRAMLRLFSAVGLMELESVRLVEVGAGTGGNLLELLRAGFAPENLIGVELLAERVAVARRCLPSAVRFESGDAAALAIEAGSLDIVYQSVVFSSLLDDGFQQRMATAMWRWLKPGGAVLWYDFTYNNPSNPDVRGVPMSRVRELFPAARIRAQRVTLAPPIARKVAALHPSLYTWFNLLPLLRTHLLCWIEKP
jgi:SAM-dependent methyltransferase